MSVWIPVNEANVGIEYRGYKTFDNPKALCFCSVEYLGDNKGLVFGKDLVENISELSRETTWQERDKWYVDRFDIDKADNQLNLLGLFKDMYDVGDASHEMWNAWIGTNFYEMNFDCNDNNITLIGIAPAPYPCSAIRNAVAFVAEDEDGNRFWSHGSQDWVEDMRDEMRDIYDNFLNKFRK